MGCDVSSSKVMLGLSPFQSTHPHGVRRWEVPFTFLEQYISIHAPAWGATTCAYTLAQIDVISIHAPAWGATSCPRRYGGSSGPISIHAPAWGATSYAFPPQSYVSYFNPRTRMGCDRPSDRHQSFCCHFNPRTRMGCDSPSVSTGQSKYLISIHAPAWGATV